MDVNGDVKYEVNGRWNEQLNIKDMRTCLEEPIWKADPKPPNSDRQYGFGLFTLNMNYMDEDMKKYLPPTDTRRRRDQRLMEEGKIEEAAAEKHRLEEKQRAIRKQREAQGLHHKPLYFVEYQDEHCGEKSYKFNDVYWEKRRKNDWRDSPDLF